MNKKLFIMTALLAFTAGTIGVNSVMAEESAAPVQTVNEKNNIVQPRAFHYVGEVPPADRYFGPGPKVDKDHPMKFNGPKHFDKAEMQAKKAEFENRLKLTEEQKKQIEDNKLQDREKMKPIIDEMKIKRQELKSIQEDSALTPEEKQKKIEETKASLKDLRTKAEELHKTNMANFETILTEKQKKEFTKIKNEQKKEMEKRRKQFQKSQKNKKIVKPVQPKPVPEKQ